jgi:hypothetical protein
MPHAYTIGQLVEQPAIGLFAELGWAMEHANSEFRRSSGLLLPSLLSGLVVFGIGKVISQK